VDLTADAGELSTTVSWHEPHPIFVILLVGPDEIPFGIQKDLLCAQSPYYRQEFSKNNRDNKVEHIVKLADTDVDIFGCFQNFIYTGDLYDRRGGRSIPDYPLLLGVWKLATKLKMAPLRVAVLNVMAERRQQTSCIPGTPLLIQAWKETEEGSGLRLMLIGWAAEHMRSSPQIRSDFAKSLPHEILSELVIVMSDLPATPNLTPQSTKRVAYSQTMDAPQLSSAAPKRSRKSDVGVSNGGGEELVEIKPPVKRPPRRSTPSRRSGHRTSNTGPWSVVENAVPSSADKDLLFCRDLITRMLSGPGYWTRLVGPFKEPVDPVLDNVPNYFSVVKKPMDLRTVQTKLNLNVYANAEEFEKDIRLIFQNCYEYWTQDDGVFKLCEQFEKYFNEKWAAKHKWIVTQIKAEAAD